jgi:hypothetical protein
MVRKTNNEVLNILEALRREMLEDSKRTARFRSVLVPRGKGVFSVEREQIENLELRVIDPARQ